MPDQGTSQSFHIPAATFDDGVNDTNDSLTLWAWTQSGFPIVDRKYIGNGTLKDANPDEAVVSGPPALAVYWHNRYLEYTVRLGSFFAETKGRL
ncbi:hypothetical protein MY10362_002425 [Beauveria mimosiformis]